MPESNNLYGTLRKLVIEDPREAARVFLLAFDSNAPELADLLVAVRSPGNGRLRQLIANAVRNHAEKRRLISDLLNWRDTETDEFARRAIESALSGVDVEAVNTQNPRGAGDPARLIEVYRYLSERLRHKLRNKMLDVQVHAEEIKDALAANNSDSTTLAITNLNEDVIAFGRILEAADVDPGHFAQRAIVLHEWLKSMNQRYSAQYLPVPLHINGEEAKSTKILGSDYLLETIFWNLWTNSQQAVGAACKIVVDMKLIHDHRLEVIIVDNGRGLPRETVDLVFRQAFSSTRSISRGRGLLEVEDAVERLGGRVLLVEIPGKGYRVKVVFPVHTQ